LDETSIRDTLPQIESSLGYQHLGKRRQGDVLPFKKSSIGASKC